MAVSNPVASESHTGTTGAASVASFTWNHAGGTGIRGVAVVVSTISATDTVTSVTYGGTSMTRVSGGAAIDNAGEPGRADLFFLGASVPTGTQAVVVNRTNNATVMYAAAVSVDAAMDTKVTGVATITGDAALTEQSVNDGSPGTNSFRFAGGYSGLQSVPAVGANTTALNSIDFGNFVSGLWRETNAGEGARSVGPADAGTDDRAMIYWAIRETVSTRPVGMATSTETAFALTRTKIRSVGMASAASTALAVAPVVKIYGGGLLGWLAKDTETAPALTTTQIYPPGFSLIFSFAWGRPGLLISTGRADETDVALAQTIRKVRTVGMATSANTAFARTLLRGYSFGVSSETDLAFAQQIKLRYSYSFAASPNTALSLTIQIAGNAGWYFPRGFMNGALFKEYFVGLAGSTNLALPPSVRKVRSIGLASETDVALILGVGTPGLRFPLGFTIGGIGRAIPVGLASETDTAFARPRQGAPKLVPVRWAQEQYAVGKLNIVRIRSYGIATSTNIALAPRMARAKAVGMAISSNVAIARPTGIVRTYGIAISTNTAFLLVSRRINAIGLAIETDNPFSIPLRKARVPGIATSANTAFARTKVKATVVGFAIETDTALRPPLRQKIAIGMAVSVNQALPVTMGKVPFVKHAEHNNISLPLGLQKTKSIAFASETDQALSLAKVIVRSVGIATEVDQALSTRGGRQVSVGIATSSNVAVACRMARRKAYGICQSNNIALSIALRKRWTVRLASEIDSAHPIVRTKGIQVGVATSLNTARSLRLIAKIAVEKDIAPVMVFKKGGVVVWPKIPVTTGARMWTSFLA